MKRAAIAIEVELPDDADLFSIDVGSVVLIRTHPTIGSPPTVEFDLRPVGVGAYLRPTPPAGRIVRAEIHPDPSAVFPDDEPITPETEITHRHADGSEHAHAGARGFAIGGQNIEDTYGDERSHSHSTLSITGDAERGADSGPVVWSERDPQPYDATLTSTALDYDSREPAPRRDS